MTQEQIEEMNERIKAANNDTPRASKSVANLVEFAQFFKGRATDFQRTFSNGETDPCKINTFVESGKTIDACDNLLEALSLFVGFVVKPKSQSAAKLLINLERSLEKANINFYMNSGVRKGDRDSIRSFRNEMIRLFSCVDEHDRSKAFRLARNVLYSLCDVIDAVYLVNGKSALLV